MKKLHSHLIFIALIFVLSIFFVNKILHKDVVMNNVHYINDLTFLSYNTKLAIESGQAALWTPYFYGGHPLIGIPENFLFDLNFIFIYLLRDIYLSMNLSVLSYFFIAGLGMYLLSFALFQSKRAAFISALIYMFNGFMASFVMNGHLNILEGYSLIPLVFFFVHRAIKSDGLKLCSIQGIVCGILLAMQILAGSMIMFIYTVLLVGAYMAFSLIGKNFRQTALKVLLAGVLMGVTCLGISAVKLLPSMEFVAMSSRSGSVQFQEFLGNPISIGGAVNVITGYGDYVFSASIGILGLLLLLYGLSNYRKKIVLFSALLIIFSILFASGTFVAGFMYKLPAFGKLRHIERALVLFIFSVSLLIGLGFDSVSKKLAKFSQKKKYQYALFGLIAALVVFEAVSLHDMPKAARVFQPDEVGVLNYMARDGSDFRTMNLVLNDIIGAAGYNYYAQKGISEIKGGGGIWINEFIPYLSVAQTSLSAKVLNIMSVKYLVSDYEISSQGMVLVGNFSPCVDCGGLVDAFGTMLYKNDMFMPRYYSPPNAVLLVGDKNSAMQATYNLMSGGLDVSKTILVESAALDNFDAKVLGNFGAVVMLGGELNAEAVSKLREYAGNGGILLPNLIEGKKSVDGDDLKLVFGIPARNMTEVKVLEYSNNRVALDIKEIKGWMYVSERFAHFPGWHASVDGKEIPLFRSNDVASAVYLENGGEKLVFDYKPDSYVLGKRITWASLALILAYFGVLAYFGFKSRKKIGATV
jgi:hypothetical protein